MQTNSKTTRPAPPEELDGEPLLEWHRVCGELEAAGRLEKTDRAILVLYVETWAAWRAVSTGVTKFGAVIKFPNGVTGASPFAKLQKEYGTQLRGLLNDLGLTPAARATKSAATEPADLPDF